MSPTADTHLDARTASHILQRLGQGGLPPLRGIRHINVGTDRILGVLEQEYFQRHLRDGASFKLVEGYYGSGKTHFLTCVRELAWDHDFVAARIELSPVECPFDDPVAVYRAVARGITPPPVPGSTDEPLPGFADLIRDTMRARFDALLAEHDGDEIEARKLAQAWIRSALQRAWCESASYRAAVVAIARSEVGGPDATPVEAWIAGEPVPASAVRGLGVYESITRTNGFLMLRAMVQMVRALGYAGTMIAFDEGDRNLSVSRSRARTIADHLRQLIDLCGRHELPGTLLLYAVPPEFRRDVVSEYPALKMRLETPDVLSIMNPQSALIDLERIDLQPGALLRGLGARLIPVAEAASGVRLDAALQQGQLDRLADLAAQLQFETSHRRLYAKAAVALLQGQVQGNEHVLSDMELERLLQADAVAF